MLNDSSLHCSLFLLSIGIASMTVGTVMAQEVPGLTIDGADMISSEVIELDDIINLELSTYLNTLTIVMDHSLLMPGSSFDILVNGVSTDFEQIQIDDSTSLTLNVFDSEIMLTLAGVAFVTESAGMPVEEVPVEEVPVEEMPVDESVATEEPVEESAPAELVAAEPIVEDVPEPVLEEVTAAPSSPVVQSFVEPDVEIRTYVDRYLNDAAFIAWYDEYYSGVPFHEGLGISESEYQTLVNDIMMDCPPNAEFIDGQCVVSMVECGAGTTLVDNQCVAVSPTDAAPATAEKASAQEVYETQGGGLQIGVAATVGFSIAIAVLLVLWLPGRIRKRYRDSRR